MIRLALVDDHIIFRKALAAYMKQFTQYQVQLEASHGLELQEQLKIVPVPDLIILDIRMPIMNGFETTEYLLSRFPGLKILVVSMLPEMHHLENLLQMGVCGYVQKDADMEELQRAIDQIIHKGHYLNPAAYVQLISDKKDIQKQQMQEAQLAAHLSDREREFLRRLCTDKGYKEIAGEMFVSPRTIDGYRDALLKKLSVSSRIGLVTFAIRQGIAEI
ncbi:MAG: response regulator transcription factor [Chitinophagia bacterium]|jgi:DNA-binding NarL/FixJ family response regulator